MATILVVDDHPDNREFLVTLLAYAGHRLLEADDGVKALEVMHTEHPDLVIVDIVMPNMDGYEFVHQVRSEPTIAQTRIIFWTATYLQSEAWALAQACGVHHIITKPADPEIVLRNVTEALDLTESIAQTFMSSEAFHQEHLRLLTDKLAKQVEELEQEVVERKQLEAALQRERDILETTLTCITEGVVATDPTARLTFLNPVAEALTGWAALDARGRKFDEIFHIINEETRQPVENLAERVLREGRASKITPPMLLIARSGKEMPIVSDGALIQSKSGRTYGVVLVFHDITEQKQTETLLKRAKEAAEAADRIKSDFLATMSHELRTPLNVMLGYLELFLDGEFGEPTALQTDILRRLNQNSQVLYELITMVLDLNRLEAGQLPVEIKRVWIRDLIEEIREEMHGLCDQSRLTFIWLVGEALPVIYTDPGKLKVVVKNLLGNAIKFTDKGRVAITVEAENKGVAISVADTGIGIPKEAHAMIFEPFRQVDSSATRRYSGSGLGLNIVKRLLEVLKGTITVESEVGRGSKFRVWIPE